MSSGYLPKTAKQLETRAVIRMYLQSSSLASGFTNMVFSVLKDWAQMPCQWGTGLQRENWNHELPACYCKKWTSLFHCKILSHFLPARVVCTDGQNPGNANPCLAMSCLQLIGKTFFSSWFCTRHSASCKRFPGKSSSSGVVFGRCQQLQCVQYLSYLYILYIPLYAISEHMTM